MHRFRHFPLLAAAALLLASSAELRAVVIVETPGWALENFAGAVRNYNVVALSGGATFSNYGTTQGPLAIEGNLTIAGGTIANSPASYGASSDPALYVSGRLFSTGTTTLANGYASLPGETTADFTWSASAHTLTATNASGSLHQSATSGSNASTSPLTNPAPAGFDWTDESATLLQSSTTLAKLADSGTITVSHKTLTFTPDTTPAAGAIVVFTLDASKISGSQYQGNKFNSVQIDVPVDVNYVINVVNAAGTTLFGSGITMKSGTNDSQLLWNVEGSSGTVNLGGGTFYGAVLAPSVIVSNGGAIVSGQVGAYAFADTGQALDFSRFENMASVVAPEPPACALWGLVLCGCAVVARKFKNEKGSRPES